MYLTKNIFILTFTILSTLGSCAESPVEPIGNTTPTGDAYKICIINEGSRSGECKPGIALDFGNLESGYDVTRFVKITPLRPISIKSFKLDARLPELKMTLMRLDNDSLVESQSTIFNPSELAYIRYRLKADAPPENIQVKHTIITIEADLEDVIEKIPIEINIEGCAKGFADCDGDLKNGCETNLKSDVLNCGICANTCELANTDPSCNNGVCGVDRCKMGFNDCDNELSNGCEVNTNTNAKHCGSCGNTCMPDDGTKVCLAAECKPNMCPVGKADCDVNAAGCETDTTSTLAHCGACGQACVAQNGLAGCEASACTVASCTAPFDNCNADPTDGCESNTMDDPMNCGACGNVCDVFGTVPTCIAKQCSATDCLPNHYNINQDLADGCEYQCTFQAGFDLPDDQFSDDNCDGIDGDISKAIFVSPHGNDLNNGGKSTPFATLSKGIEEADRQGKDVYIAVGTYSEPTITLRAGVNIFGGFDANTWARTASHAILNSTSTTAITSDGINVETHIEYLEIRAKSNSGASGSSYGLFLKNSDLLTFNHCIITAGDGGDGPDGIPPGSSAHGGEPGKLGDPGCEDSSGAFCSNCPRPSGGDGGMNTFCPQSTAGGKGGGPGRDDDHGDNGGAGGGGASGGTGAPDDKGNWNTDIIHTGDNGIAGGPGMNGNRSEGQYITNGFIPGHGKAGKAGINGGGGGAGGGGGGGDDGCNSYGAGGGGGGAGGCGGEGAPGGVGGGGSFAIYLYGSDVSIKNCVLRTGRGGNGGDGGNGQAGGQGGKGGKSSAAGHSRAGNNYSGSSEQDDASNGGRGGDGGDGGRGGHGAGGDGGPSFGILGVLSAPTVQSVTYFIGAAGLKGNSSGTSGASGVSKNQELR